MSDLITLGLVLGLGLVVAVIWRLSGRTRPTGRRQPAVRLRPRRDDPPPLSFESESPEGAPLGVTVAVASLAGDSDGRITIRLLNDLRGRPGLAAALLPPPRDGIHRPPTSGQAAGAQVRLWGRRDHRQGLQLRLAAGDMPLDLPLDLPLACPWPPAALDLIHLAILVAAPAHGIDRHRRRQRALAAAIATIWPALENDTGDPIHQAAAWTLIARACHAVNDHRADLALDQARLARLGGFGLI